MAEWLGKILVVDDDLSLRRLLSTLLEAHGFECDSVPDLDSMRRAIREHFYDAALVDLILENEDGFSAIPDLVNHAPKTKIFMMSAHGTIEIAVSAMEQGATAFIAKSKDPNHIISELKRRLSLPSSPRLHLETMFGSSAAMKALLSEVENTNRANESVVVTGEEGTGKTWLAEYLHETSKLSDKRLARVNCAALTESAQEEEFFGTEKRRGVIEHAKDGTLLIRHIEMLSPKVLERLVSTLTENKNHPIRLIATSTAAKLDLKPLVPLNAVALTLPALRNRKEDIAELAEAYRQFVNHRFGKNIASLDQAEIQHLQEYPWPGNLRELMSSIERGIILSTDGKLYARNILAAEPAPDDQNSLADKTLSEAKQDFERMYLKQLLETTRGNISEMARISGRYRTDIYRLLTKHGVDWDEFRNDEET